MEPNLPKPGKPAHGYNMRADEQQAVIMLIDRVSGVITTFEVVNKIHRAIPNQPSSLDSQIAAARLAGTLVLERVHTNSHWLASVQPDFSDEPGRYKDML